MTVVTDDRTAMARDGVAGQQYERVMERIFCPFRGQVKIIYLNADGTVDETKSATIHDTNWPWYELNFHDRDFSEYHQQVWDPDKIYSFIEVEMDEGQHYVLSVPDPRQEVNRKLSDTDARYWTPNPACMYEGPRDQKATAYPFGNSVARARLAPAAPLAVNKRSRAAKNRPLHIEQIHVGTYTQEGTFRAIIERLDVLASRGIDTLQFLPFFQTPGDYSWGYSGIGMAINPAYGSLEDLRNLISESHKRGIAIVGDLVFNHFGSDADYYAPMVESQFDPKTQMLTIRDERMYASFSGAWGAALNCDGRPVQELAEHVIGELLDLGMDGFRLDATDAYYNRIKAGYDTALLRAPERAMRFRAAEPELALSPFPFAHYLTRLIRGVQRYAGGRRLAVASCGHEPWSIIEAATHSVRNINPEEKGGFGARLANEDLWHAVSMCGKSYEPGTHQTYQEPYADSEALADVLRYGFLPAEADRVANEAAEAYDELGRFLLLPTTDPLTPDQWERIVLAYTHDQSGGNSYDGQPSLDLEKRLGFLALAAMTPASIATHQNYLSPAPFIYFEDVKDAFAFWGTRTGRLGEFAPNRASLQEYARTLSPEEHAAVVALVGEKRYNEDKQRYVTVKLDAVKDWTEPPIFLANLILSRHDLERNLKRIERLGIDPALFRLPDNLSYRHPDDPELVERCKDPLRAAVSSSHRSLQFHGRQYLRIHEMLADKYGSHVDQYGRHVPATLHGVSRGAGHRWNSTGALKVSRGDVVTYFNDSSVAKHVIVDRQTAMTNDGFVRLVSPMKMLQPGEFLTMGASIDRLFGTPEKYLEEQGKFVRALEVQLLVDPEGRRDQMAEAVRISGRRFREHTLGDANAVVAQQAPPLFPLGFKQQGMPRAAIIGLN